MTEALHHRGPDGSGVYVDPHGFLGHRRLSIVDLSTGSQPMFNEDGSLVVTYNGEIFNHAAIRTSLEHAGHRYSTRSDTETILHAYEQYGAACIDLFRGMFAFAIWNRRARRLFCARDRLGIKPFYYYWDGEVFVFGSEIKALLEHPAVPRAVNDTVIPDILSFGYTTDDRTLFQGIHKLMPGHHLVLDLAEPRPRPAIRQYWDIPLATADEAPRSDSAWISEVRRRLEETVELRLMSDVPLGMFLSGGVDSSAIAALVRRLTEGPLKTFAVGYDETAFSELAYARQAADHLGTDHHAVTIGLDDFFNALPTLVWHEDEPLAWPSSVPLYFVSRLAARHVKVVLTGEGSDELLAGYERYRHSLFNMRWGGTYWAIPTALRSAIRRRLATTSLLSADLRRKLSHTVLARTPAVESLHLDNFYCAFSASELRALMPPSTPLEIYGPFLAYWSTRTASPALARMLYADQKTYLVELLMKQDQMSMAASLESRVPFLDHTFVEFCTRIPDHLKIRHRTSKYILKRAVRDLLPPSIVDRAKMGFPTPLREWLRHSKSAPYLELLSARDGLLASFVDARAVARLVSRHRAGTEDATDRIWRLLNLQLWGAVFLDRRRDLWKSTAGTTTPA
jgi:asparagine synthase (glutamine-hydrolysing)